MSAAILSALIVSLLAFVIIAISRNDVRPYCDECAYPLDAHNADQERQCLDNAASGRRPR